MSDIAVDDGFRENLAEPTAYSANPGGNNFGRRGIGIDNKFDQVDKFRTGFNHMLDSFGVTGI